MINVPITFDEAYQFIKLYDTLRDMDFELTESQQNVFEKIQGVFKPVGKYDAKNPAQDDFGIYDNMTIKRYAYHISLAESQGRTWRYVD